MAVSAASRRLYVNLATISRKGVIREPSREIARKVGCSRRTVWRRLAELERAGLVRRSAEPAGSVSTLEIELLQES